MKIAWECVLLYIDLNELQTRMGVTSLEKKNAFFFLPGVAKVSLLAIINNIDNIIVLNMVEKFPFDARTARFYVTSHTATFFEVTQVTEMSRE
jgi:hypothetical protein